MMASETSGSSAKKTTKRAATSGSKSAKRPVKRPVEQTRSADEGADATRKNAAPRAEAGPPARASKVASEAVSELAALTGKDAEGVTGLERSDDGWVVRVEVVELRRIPDTTDVLALYEVQTDSKGVLQSYQRVRRYVRGVPDND